MESLDNAGVYRLNNTTALIQTVDFFTPIVDDPYYFGQIAAANSLSDIYTMGGRPLTAMNIVCFPTNKLDISVLQQILLGGIDKMKEAGVILIGGHSVQDNELKYGLSVTGVVNPSRLVTNSGAKAGDKLILAKPLGTGIISTAGKSGKVNKRTIDIVTESMCQLNKAASELMLKYRANSCTDITGFGLIGHISQVAQNSKVCIKIDSSAIPYFPEARPFSEQGLMPGGLHRNKQFYSKFVDVKQQVPEYIIDIIYDPQTSGGLVISIPSSRAAKLLTALKKAGYKESTIIGSVELEPEGRIALL